MNLDRNLFDSIINKRRKNLFIFTFGASGMGKTAMLIYLFQEIKNRFGFAPNLQDEYSSKLFEDYTIDFEVYKRLQDETATLGGLMGTPFQYVDVGIDSKHHHIHDTKLTFLEFSGEDIESIYPGFQDKLTMYKDSQNGQAERKSETIKEERKTGPSAVTGRKVQNKENTKTNKENKKAGTGGYTPGKAVKFTEGLDVLLTHPNIYVMCFVLASAQYAPIEDYLLSKFISLVRQNPKYLRQLISMNLVITKWDQANYPDDEIETFAQTNLRNSYNLLSSAQDKGLKVNLMPFSVGTIDPHDPLKVSSPNMAYASRILDLITDQIKSEKSRSEFTESKNTNKSKPKKRPPKDNGDSIWKKLW